MILWRFTEIVVYINNLSIFIKFHFMYFTKWMCHNLFSHSPADRHLDFSPLFTITRKVAMHIYVQILLEYSFFSLQDNYLGVQFLGNMVVIYLVLWETRKMFSNLVPGDFRTAYSGLQGRTCWRRSIRGQRSPNMKVQTRGGHGEKQQILAGDWG